MFVIINTGSQDPARREGRPAGPPLIVNTLTGDVYLALDSGLKWNGKFVELFSGTGPYSTVTLEQFRWNNDLALGKHLLVQARMRLEHDVDVVVGVSAVHAHDVRVPLRLHVVKRPSIIAGRRPGVARSRQAVAPPPRTRRANPGDLAARPPAASWFMRQRRT